MEPSIAPSMPKIHKKNLLVNVYILIFEFQLNNEVLIFN